jgi:hypothetical protein
MRSQRLTASLLTVLLLGALASGARASDTRLEVGVVRGSIADSGNRATVRLAVNNDASVAIRLVGLRAEYDSPAGDTLLFESTDAFDLRVEAGRTAEPDVACTTEYAEGTWIDWRNPYALDVALGADIAGLRALAEGAGARPDRVAAALGDVRVLSQRLRRSRQRFPERVAAVTDSDAWFDVEAVEALREPLEAALCSALGRTVTSAGGSETRVSAYRAAVALLTANDLYPDCLASEVRLTVARAMVAIGSAQDALVLTERDAEGQIPPEWTEVYVAGRLALAQMAVEAEGYGQFRPAVDSLAEVRRLAPDDRRLAELAPRLLGRVASKVEQALREQRENDALQLVELLRERFADHPETERASRAMLQALAPWAERSLAEGHPVRANNAYVRGLTLFGEMEAWPAVGGEIQAARRDHQVAAAQRAVEAGDLDAAEEALRSAGQLAPVEPAVAEPLEDQILLLRWAALDERVAAGDFELAMERARLLERGARRPEVLGEARPAFYLRVSEAVWERYGMLAGVASRTRLSLAEEALELGRAANPEAASALATRLLVARWIFPAAIGLVLVLAGVVLLVRGGWRKRRKARRLWQSGVARAERGDFGRAANLLERAWTLLETDPDPAPLVGEETRGHLVLRIAAVHDQRGRKDRVDEMRAEWALLSEFERPYDPDFDRALSELRG